MVGESRSPSTPETPNGETTASARHSRRRKGRLGISEILLTLMILVVVGLVAALGYGAYRFSRRAVEVPNVLLMTSSDAEAEIGAAGLELGSVSEMATATIGPGRVGWQSPSAPGTAQRSSSVDVTLAVAPEEAATPDVVGKTQAQAEDLLANALFPAGVFSEYSDTVPAGTVVEQAPLPGELSMTGYPVAIVVSLGSGATGVAVPKIVGRSIESATDKLAQTGLPPIWLYNSVSRTQFASVVRQVPSAGALVPEGSQVVGVVSIAVPSTHLDTQGWHLYLVH